MLKRLRLQFICFYMILVFIGLIILCTILLNTTGHRLKSYSVDALESAGEDWPPESLEDGDRSKPLCFAITMDENGDFHFDGPPIESCANEQYLQKLWQSALDDGKECGVIWKQRLRFLRRENQIIFCDISTQHNIMRNLTLTCFTSGIAVLLLFFLVSLFLARQTVKPVEKAWEQQKRFIADASHELKTPLTVITTNAELLQERCSQEPEAHYAENILTMSRQMRGLTEGLLNLARLDNRGARQEFAEVDLSALTEETILPFEVIFFEKDLPFLPEIQPNLRVNGESKALRQVLEILLDNAGKYANPQTEVRLSLKRCGSSHCLLAVQTHGEELSKEQLSHIFERFYRCDAARPINHSYGLGLSIAQSIVQEHKGKIWAESKDGLNTFFVQLPAT